MGEARSFRRIELETIGTSACAACDAVRASGLPVLMKTVSTALDGMAARPRPEAEVVPLVPAVPIREAVTDDDIARREDGRKSRSPSRRLQDTFGPMPGETGPARRMGLGRRQRG